MKCITVTTKMVLVGWTCLSIGLEAVARESEDFAAKVISAHHLTGESARIIRGIVTTSVGMTRNIGTEDPLELKGPNNSWHMTTRQNCIDKVLKTGLIKQNPNYEARCKAPWMAPINDHVCIDQFEFPDIPCEYPVVWTDSATAKQVCEAMGKRVCNSHEWESACSGSDRPVSEYNFQIPDRRERRAFGNRNRKIVWAFQFQRALNQVTDSRGVCGVYAPDDPDMASPMRENPRAYFTPLGKSLTCQNGKASDVQTCGTNSWPSGFKYLCRSSFDVYDMHGNLAEVTNLPDNERQIANGRGQIGGTERKGSFFVYRSDYPDDCMVRQPYEHYGNYAVDKMSYYQEGFRCCKDIE